MTAFDLIVLLIVGVAAIGGFSRGFVQEVLSLASWILALMAISTLHTPLYNFILQYVGNGTTSAVLAFSLLLLVPYAAMKLIAGWAGNTTRKSILGPVDRVLGFGFGAVKGAIVCVAAFSLLVLGYDTVWGIAGRPAWMTTARTYPAINAGATELVDLIAERRAEVSAAQERLGAE